MIDFVYFIMTYMSHTLWCDSYFTDDKLFIFYIHTHTHRGW